MDDSSSFKLDESVRDLFDILTVGLILNQQIILIPGERFNTI